MDEVHVCVLRALAVDETSAERAERGLDVSLLDAMTWPAYAWEMLRLTGGRSCGCWLGAGEPAGGGGAAAGWLARAGRLFLLSFGLLLPWARGSASKGGEALCAARECLA